METYREQYRMLGLRIAYYRKKANWTQEQFAKQVGCSPGFLSQIESNSGKYIKGISLPMLLRIAEVLDIHVSKLFEESTE